MLTIDVVSVVAVIAVSAAAVSVYHGIADAIQRRRARRGRDA
jgi:hypothetical protein